MADLPTDGMTEHNNKKTDGETPLLVDIRSIPKVEAQYLIKYGTREHEEMMACFFMSIGPEAFTFDCRDAARQYNNITRSYDNIQPENFLRKLNNIRNEVTARWREDNEGGLVDRSSLMVPGRPAYVQADGSKLAGNGGRKRKREEPSPEAGSSSNKRRKLEEPSPELDPVMLKAEFSCGLA